MQLNDTAHKLASQKYNQMSGEFDQRRDTYLRQHPGMAHKTGSDFDETKPDWQAQMQMDQGIRLVADMQVALQKEMRSVLIAIQLVITGMDCYPHL